jgi:hypothetical protein
MADGNLGLVRSASTGLASGPAGLASGPAGGPMLLSTPYIVLGGLREEPAIGVRQLAHDPARHASEKDASRNAGIGQYHGSCGHQGARPDPRPAQDDSPDPDECPGSDVGAVDRRPVPQADSLLQDHGLAGIHVQAAQILDVAVRPDGYLVLVSSKDSSVPDARASADRDPAHQHRATGHPCLRMD